MLDWAMARPAFKTQLFRFVDVFPAMVDDADVARHLHEYFEGQEVPKALDLGHRRGRARAVRQGRRGPGRPQEHRPDGRAVHRRDDAGRSGRGAPRAVAAGERGHRRPAGREDDRRPRRRPLRRPGPRHAHRALRRDRDVGAGRPPRAGRPRPDPTGEREHQAHRARRALRAPHPRGGPAPGLGAAPAPAPPRPRPRRHRPLRHGARRREGPHAPAVPRPARRGRVRRPRRRHRHPGLPARQPRRPRRPDRLVGAAHAGRSPCGW